ncbi:hypothetical protein CDD81_8052 [Ophiocordyceps australis]|uniref:Amino acid permease/ SLC12A domain-containing protein n=1 Tax=Ophiocordyceps australis TaxID=1399860 RepID=A0A2C5XZ35_9HYPO|nr:hypothetical protein CDD81_8052 [Ophiocordyceps australis]
MSDLDAADLAALGHAQSLSRSFSPLSMLALSFSVLGTWSTCAQNLGLGLSTGGPVAILWGLVLVALCNTCVAASLGELVSSMPTALGQAYWVARLLGDDKHKPARQGEAAAQGTLGNGEKKKGQAGRFAAYMCAWINTFGWWTLAASQNAFMTDFILAMRLLISPDAPTAWPASSSSSSRSPPGWLRFVVYTAITCLATAFNHVASRNARVLPLFNSLIGAWFAVEFFLYATALPTSVHLHPALAFQPAAWVFGGWINQTGWPDAVVFLMGLVQGAYGLTAFDTVIHMVEEIPSPRRNAPRTMCLAVVLGAVSGFVFMLICLFCIQDVSDVIGGAEFSFPFITITSSIMGRSTAAVLIGLFIANGLGQAVSVQTSASRLTWSFARDGGIPHGQSYFAHVDEKWHAPVRALWLQAVIVSLVGLLYLFSDAVLQAILSVSTIALTLSYGMPIFALMLVGRRQLPPRGQFGLGPRLGPVINTISILYCITTTIVFFFPHSPNPGIRDMNWAIAVFGVMLVISIGFWLIQGCNTFMAGIGQADEGVVVEAVLSAQSSVLSSGSRSELLDPAPAQVESVITSNVKT